MDDEFLEPVIFPSCCSSCLEIVSEKYVYCTHCGYPQNGSVKQMALHEKAIIDCKKDASEANRKIKNARTTLYVISVITFLFGLISFSGELGSALLTVSFIQSIIYLILGFWSNKKPLIALLMGLFLYLTVIIISAVTEPSTVIKGIIFKVIIISFLGRGIYAALSLKKLEDDI